MSESHPISETAYIPPKQDAGIEPVHPPPTPQESDLPGASAWYEEDFLDDGDVSAREEAERNRRQIASQITQDLLIGHGLVEFDEAEEVARHIQERVVNVIVGKESEIRADNIAEMFVAAAKASTILNNGELSVDYATTLLQVPRGSVEVANLLPTFAQKWVEITSEASSDQWKSIARDPNAQLPELLWVMVQPGSQQMPPEMTSSDQAKEVFGAMLSSCDSVVKLINLGVFPKTALTTMLYFRHSRASGQLDASKVALTVAEVAEQGLSTDELLTQFSEQLNRYATYHGFDDQRMLASVSNVLPRMSDDSEVSKVLRRGGGVTVIENNFGQLDFYIHALTSEATPLNVRELLSALTDVPTIDVNNFETNRRDALVLAEPFGALRDLIHDQRPGAHDLLVAMDAYYRVSKTDKDSTQARREVEKAIERCREGEWRGKLDQVLDLAKYDEVTDTHRNPDNESNIQIVRRLIENTRPVSETPPVVTDEWIKDNLEAYWANQTPKSLAELTKVMREDLDRRYATKAVGFEPSHIQALAWVGSQQRKYLSTLREKPQWLILQNPVFIEALQFTMATTDSDYDPREFGDFVEQLQDVTMPANDRKKLYLERVLKSLDGPVEKYKAMGRNDWIEALWSGNTLHEFTVLAQTSDTPRVNRHEGD